MATHECFQRHCERAKIHEDRARNAVAQRPKEAIAQQGLAIREYKEAARLRPRNEEIKKEFHNARATLKQWKREMAGPKSKPLLRFVSHFNLAIRYWDLGKATLARMQAEAACAALRHHNLPLGCASHNVKVMAEVSQRFAGVERKLNEMVSRNPDSVKPNYELGVLLFDKRMLLKAEEQLLWAQDRAKAVATQRLVERERGPLQESRDQWALQDESEGRRLKKLQNCLEGIEDDLAFLRDLKTMFADESDDGKNHALRGTGVRDSLRPQLLPCMHCRYSSDTTECDKWWAELSSRPDVDFRL